MRNVAIVENSFRVGFVQIFLQTFAFVEEKTVVVSAVISVRQFSNFKQMVTMWLKFLTFKSPKISGTRFTRCYFQPSVGDNSAPLVLLEAISRKF